MHALICMLSGCSPETCRDDLRTRGNERPHLQQDGGREGHRASGAHAKP